jgi:hypothetical protein
VKVLPQALEPLDLIRSTQSSYEAFKQRDIYLFDIFRDDDGTRILLRVPETDDEERGAVNNVAVLNQDASKILSEIATFCTFEAYSSRQPWTSILDQTVKLEKKIYALVDIVLYADPEHCHNIGEYLTSKKVYLQEPDYWQPDLRYTNPHFLDLSDALIGKEVALDSSTISFLQHEAGIQLDISDEFSPTKEFLKQRIASAFQKTTRAKNLNRIVAHSRIRTSLKA